MVSAQLIHLSNYPLDTCPPFRRNAEAPWQAKSTSTAWPKGALIR